jgi:hypothetical protein
MHHPRCGAASRKHETKLKVFQKGFEMVFISCVEIRITIAEPRKQAQIAE